MASVLKEWSSGRDAEPPKPIESDHFLNALLGFIVKRHDPAARAFRNGGWQMEKLAGLTVLSDEASEEMRAFIPVKGTMSTRSAV